MKKIKMLSVDELLEIERELNETDSVDDKILKVYKLCTSPEFINSLCYVDTYDKNEQNIIKCLADKFSYYHAKAKKLSFFKDKPPFFRLEIDVFAERLRKINDAYAAVKSNESDHMKAFKLVSLFPEARLIKSSFYYILLDIDRPSVQVAREALENLDLIYDTYVDYENRGIMNLPRYVSKTISYHENYRFAEFVIENYIAEIDDGTYKEKTFYSRYGLDKETFRFCVDTIEELNPKLYKEYKEKGKQIVKIMCFRNLQTFRNLNRGITSGFLEDGTEFNILEFIKRVPFKYDRDFIGHLTSFLKNNASDLYASIMNYMYSNKLTNPKSYKPIYVKEEIDSKQRINGRQIDEEIIRDVIDYLNVSDVIVIRCTYDYVMKKYLSGDITKEMIDEMREKKKEEMKNKTNPIVVPGKKKTIER